MPKINNFEQLSLFEIPAESTDRTVYVYPDCLKRQQEWVQKWENRLKVGDKVSRVFLGECEIGTIYEVEGNERYFFYRTDAGCFMPEEADTDIDANLRKAEENRKNFVTIEPKELTERITVRYAPRQCDGVVLCAQIGYFGDLLYWKESMTYQFCERITDEKKLRKRYEEIKRKIFADGETDGYELVGEMPMKRLYLRHSGLYAEARYSAEPPVRASEGV